MHEEFTDYVSTSHCTNIRKNKLHANSEKMLFGINKVCIVRQDKTIAPWNNKKLGSRVHVTVLKLCIERISRLIANLIILTSRSIFAKVSKSSAPTS